MSEGEAAFVITQTPALHNTAPVEKEYRYGVSAACTWGNGNTFNLPEWRVATGNGNISINHALRLLMISLYQCGLRPFNGTSNGSSSRGMFRSINNHHAVPLAPDKSLDIITDNFS